MTNEQALPLFTTSVKIEDIHFLSEPIERRLNHRSLKSLIVYTWQRGGDSNKILLFN